MAQLSAAAAESASESAQQAVGFPTLFLLVVLGSVAPVVPTGAVVSSAAVVGFHHKAPFTLLLVFAVAAAAAFLGDVALYWLGRRGVHSRNGSRWLRQLQERAPEQRLAGAERGLREHGVAVLVLSRLIPAGRVPIMLACLMADMPLRVFARADIVACLAWAALYGAIGILGGSLFPEPWQGVVLAVALTVLISTAPTVYRRIRGTRRTAPEAPGAHS
ncbi:DedA family protein [Streptomyces capparidis]